MSAAETSAKINNCVHSMERTLCLALMPNYLSIKKNEDLQKVLQRHEIFCEHLEMPDFHNSQEKQDTDSDTENRIKAVLLVKKSFKNVCSTLAQSYPNPDHQYVKGLPEDVTAVQQLFFNSLKTIVSKHFPSSQKEETVPIEIDNELNIILAQLSTNLTEMDLLIDQCKREIQNIRLKLEEEPESVCCKDAQLYLEEATIKKASLQLELDRLIIQINKMYSENRNKERQIQEETEKVMDATEYMFQCFDSKMEEEQADLEAKEEELLRGEEELMKTEQLFKALEVEYKEVLERRRLEEEQKKEEMRILQLKTRAAIIAQAWWRGYRVRKTIKEQSKKKAKKGKKNKKTK